MKKRVSKKAKEQMRECLIHTLENKIDEINHIIETRHVDGIEVLATVGYLHAKHFGYIFTAEEWANFMNGLSRTDIEEFNF